MGGRTPLSLGPQHHPGNSAHCTGGPHHHQCQGTDACWAEQLGGPPLSTPSWRTRESPKVCAPFAFSFCQLCWLWFGRRSLKQTAHCAGSAELPSALRPSGLHGEHSRQCCTVLHRLAGPQVLKGADIYNSRPPGRQHPHSRVLASRELSGKLLLFPSPRTTLHPCNPAPG